MSEPRGLSLVTFTAWLAELGLQEKETPQGNSWAAGLGAPPSRWASAAARAGHLHAPVLLCLPSLSCGHTHPGTRFLKVKRKEETSAETSALHNENA